MFCFQVFFCVLFGSMTTGQSAPSFDALAVAKAAGYTVFKLIDRVRISSVYLKYGFIISW